MKKIIVVSSSLILMNLFLASIVSGEQTMKQYAGYLNINTATYEQILMLPDMSAEMASNIISYRDANGPFTSVDDLIKVQGFWYTYIDEIRPYVSLEGDNTLREVSP